MKIDCDFEGLKNTLLGKYSKKIHHIELWVDKDVKEAFLGRKIENIKDDIEFWKKAGYDYIPIVTSAFGFMGDNNLGIMKEREFKYGKYSKSQKKSWAREGKGVITNIEDYNKFPWSDPGDTDLKSYIEAKNNLPENMGIIGVVPRLFVGVWTLLGYEQFSYLLVDDPDFIKKMFQKVGELQYSIFSRICNEVEVDAMWIGDDIAAGVGLMADPQFLRENLFPWYRKMGDICKNKNIPFIYHSDGDISEVIKDLIGCGFNALHPIEPKAMDAAEVKEQYGDRICILGNIELDILSRGDVKTVRELTLSRLKKLWNYGGYCPGSSNSVTDYVSLKNYTAMLDAIQFFRENYKKLI